MATKMSHMRRLQGARPLDLHITRSLTPGHTPHVRRLRLAHMAGRRDPGSAIFVSSGLSSSRPPRLGRPSAPSLRDGFASPDRAQTEPRTGVRSPRNWRLRRRRGKSGADGLGGAALVARPIIQAARDGIAVAAAAYQELGRGHDVAITVTSMNGGQ
jgi:hypothetical protein